MGIKANSSEVEVAQDGGGVKLFTGLTNVEVIAINPTLAELNALGIMFTKEPEYTATFDTGVMTKIAIWLKNADGTFKMEVLVTPGPWAAKSGKLKWYNNIGQEAWAELTPEGTMDMSGLKEWDKNRETFYQMPKGMDVITEFVRAWANVASGEEIKLDTYDAISRGDVAELRALMTTVIPGNQLRVLVYVKDGKYMNVYTKHFGRIKPLRDDLYSKMLSSDWGALKKDEECTMEWGPYSPTVPEADGTMEDAANPDWMEDDVEAFDATLDGPSGPAGPAGA
jgi:hypothetical protein